MNNSNKKVQDSQHLSGCSENEGVVGKSYFQPALLTLLLGVILFQSIHWMADSGLIPQRLFPEQQSVEVGITDLFALEAMSDTLQRDTLQLDSLKANDSDSLNKLAALNTDSAPPPLQDSTYTKGFNNLAGFFKKLFQLEKTKKGRVRIAYFGDSMIDGDLIVQDIRRSYQSTFGGYGVGFVGITSLSAAARGSISHQYAATWKTESFLTTRNPASPFGIDGQVSYAREAAWIKYHANQYSHLVHLYSPKLFYGPVSDKPDTLLLVTGKRLEDSTFQFIEPSNELLHVLPLCNTNVNNLQIYFPQDSLTPFYGLDFSDSLGVHIDNFSIRGNSGLPLSGLNQKLMNAFHEQMQYDLLVLHYGANVLHLGTTNYQWYERQMKATVEHLRACFPGAAILVISSADKSDKIGAEMQTSDAVLPLIEAQRNYAEKTQTGFLNLYQLMGGDSSMIHWQEEGLANKDYTHFNYKGAKKLAKLIYDQLNEEYLQYKKTNETHE